MRPQAVVLLKPDIDHLRKPGVHKQGSLVPESR